MKTYNNKEELKDDVNFVSSVVSDEGYKQMLVNELFNQWKMTASDSPWYDKDMKQKEKDAVKTLIKISEEGISNQWEGEHIVFNEVKPHTYNLRKR
tara:strand:- start:876 stop:1163 length:288 start_codon:yes stop_codon:yes gene_type:complete